MKKILAYVCVFLVAFSLVTILPTEAKAYNRSFFDMTYHFTEAIVMRGDGEQHVKVTKWCDYENSDMIQITLSTGETYLTHSSNVILISK